MATDHPLRLSLNDEIHGRPAMNITSPARISHFAFTKAPPGAALASLTDLCRRLGTALPAKDAVYHAITAKGFSLKWEQHGEFYTLAIAAPGDAAQAFNAPAAALLPPGFLANLPGERLVALNIAVRKGKPARFSPEKLFGHDDLAGSRVTGGAATVWMDFRIGSDGFSRALVMDHALGPARLGRLIRRLVEIETYRMAALLAFPAARQLQPTLTRLEKELTGTIGEAQKPGEAGEAELLSRLQSAAREIEETSNATNFRFAAARAYARLVNKRISELREERIEGLQRIETFLDRRFAPAMNTCEAAERRLNALAERSERASNLLRTRVDIALEAQNQSLLRSLEQSARRQLRLQQTVEGLSVVAISYYLLAILGRMLEGAETLHWGIHAKLAEAAIAPFVVLAVWLAIRRVRRSLKD
jgi:uncharacterized membrane-anchored protein